MARGVHDDAVAQEDRPVGPRGEPRLVGDEQPARARVDPRPQHPHDVLAVAESSAPVGSSASTRRRGPDQRTGDRDALLLTAGQLVGEPVARDPRRRSRPTREGLAAGRAGAKTVELTRQRHVLPGGQGGDEVEVLEHVADAASTQPRPASRSSAEVRTRERDRPVRGGVETTSDV